MTNLDKVASHPLQTSAWAEFRKQWGNEVLTTKYGIITIHKLPFTSKKIGMFIKGPSPSQQMLSDLIKIARQKDLVFIKLEPNQQTDKKVISRLKKNGAVPGKTLFTPTTFWIDLTPSEESLMKSFSSKTRYNIRLAKRHGVEVKEDNSSKAFEKYLELTRETINRQGFYAHSEKYHRLMWKILRKAGIAHLMTARYQKEIITTWILFVWKKFLYYPYGASTEKHKGVMANNIMMWESIRFGKRKNLQTFDLWGREEGKGFTKFKEGYSPKVVEFLGTWDLIVNKPYYYLYKIAEYVRWPTLKLAAKFGLSKHRF